MLVRILPLFLSLTLLTVGLTGCGGAEAEPKTEAVSAVTIAPVSNQMKFEQTEFTVKAGTEITLTFDNTATSPAMKHNVALLTDDSPSTIDRVGQAALSASSNAYVPQDDAVLAATDLAEPGETVRVTFTAPSEAGEYAYVCTFPGHYAVMQGTMRVIE